ncbi:hypothetical protein P3T23_000056 [Paraburkholderia sp. GAS448]
MPFQTQTQGNLGQSQGARIVGRGRASADGPGAGRDGGGDPRRQQRAQQ